MWQRRNKGLGTTMWPDGITEKQIQTALEDAVGKLDASGQLTNMMSKDPLINPSGFQRRQITIDNPNGSGSTITVQVGISTRDTSGAVQLTQFFPVGPIPPLEKIERDFMKILVGVTN